MSKYAKLNRFLANSQVSMIRMAFADIEGILGFMLPNSARHHGAWWIPGSTHSQCRGWTDAGFRAVSVDRAHEAVVFIRK